MRAIEPHIGNIITNSVKLVVDDYIKKSTVIDLSRFVFFILQALFNPARAIAPSEHTGVSGKINFRMPQSFQVVSTPGELLVILWQLVYMYR